MILIVFFDLPVKTKKQKREAYLFRKYLLKDGFFMMQFSVYVRISKNYALLEKHINRIEKHTPKEGSVKTIIINKEQYDNIKELVKTNSHFINIDKNYKNSSKIIYL
ncbi:CRISPR-associated endonuclease Cas2 [Brachyspira pilosicoli]|uniref:CRISPR-associated endonuclease Cas2 n=1 Tax=Brachyspira pilosicoli TaxID=52584 RepID=UPI001F5566C3|nr:CRISPR-associated endonuclease Cas2 [Brachyspira pilosicoli]